MTTFKFISSKLLLHTTTTETQQQEQQEQQQQDRTHNIQDLPPAPTSSPVLSQDQHLESPDLLFSEDKNKLTSPTPTFREALGIIRWLTKSISQSTVAGVNKLGQAASVSITHVNNGEILDSCSFEDSTTPTVPASNTGPTVEDSFEEQQSYWYSWASWLKIDSLHSLTHWLHASSPDKPFTKGEVNLGFCCFYI